MAGKPWSNHQTVLPVRQGIKRMDLLQQGAPVDGFTRVDGRPFDLPVRDRGQAHDSHQLLGQWLRRLLNRVVGVRRGLMGGLAASRSPRESRIHDAPGHGLGGEPRP